MNNLTVLNKYPLNVFKYEVKRAIENSWECHSSYVSTLMVDYDDVLDVIHSFGLSIGDAVYSLFKLTN